LEKTGSSKSCETINHLPYLSYPSSYRRKYEYGEL
jgi:hypothetical protein